MSQQDTVSFAEHWKLVRRASNDVLAWYLEQLEQSHPDFRLNQQQHAIIATIYDDAWVRYIAAAESARAITAQSLSGSYANPARSPYFNPDAKALYKKMREVYVDKGFISILGGITIVNQIGSLKSVYISDKESQPVVDVMGSATTLNVGAGFPLFAAIDAAENILGIGENVALVYHASLYQQWCFSFLRSLYPNQSADPQVFSESSGTAVNSVSIEAANAYSESIGYDSTSRLLAFQGTWSGGFGTAKEASGFGADKQIVKKTGSRWVDRCLTIPRTPAEESVILEQIQQKITDGTACGVILEHIIGDAGIITLSDDFLVQLTTICKNAPKGPLPIIVDEIQAGNGRSSSSYWSFADVPAFANYAHLIITNAKSAGGGKPYAYSLIPKSIAKAAYPLSMLTTHSGNGPIGRAVAYAKFITHPAIATLKEQTAAGLTARLQQNIGDNWRGRHLNIGITTKTSAQLELLQEYLYIQYGIIAGSFPSTLRFQPNLIEYPETLYATLAIIAQAISDINGEHSELLHSVKSKTQRSTGGLNIASN